MTHVSLLKLQRGPNLKVVISLLIDNDVKDTDEITTEIINVDDLVEVSFKFKFETRVTPYIRMKLKTSNLIAQFHVIATVHKSETQILNKQLLCSAEWLETSMEPFGYSSIQTINGKDTWAYLIHVDITVHKQFPAASLPNIDKLYEDTQFTDFQLHAADGNVPMHKSLLAANSDVFKAMMSGEWKEKGEGQINIEGVTVKTLQHLKDYMYLGVLPDEGLESLLVVASRYLMDKLKADCSKKLIQTIKLENIGSLIKFAIKHDVPELVQAMIFHTPDELVTDFYLSKIID